MEATDFFISVSFSDHARWGGNALTSTEAMRLKQRFIAPRPCSGHAEAGGIFRRRTGTF
jgi:hypothetical protein